MLTSLKAAIINIVVVLVLVIGGIAVIRWWESPKQNLQLVLSGPTQASPGDVMHFSAQLQNKPFWLKDYILDWHIYNNGVETNFQQVDNEDIILGAGLNPATFTFKVSGVGLYNHFWVHPEIQQLPEATGPNNSPFIVNVGGGPSPNPNPNPQPPQTLWGLAIFDPTQTLTPSQSAIFNSTTIEQVLMPNLWHVYYTTDMVPTSNSNAQPVSATKWGSAAVKVGLPALVVINNNGGVINSIPLPQTEMAIAQSIKAMEKR